MTRHHRHPVPIPALILIFFAALIAYGTLLPRILEVTP